MYFMLTNKRNRDAAIKEVEKLLCQLNDDWMRRCGEYMKDAYNACEGTIRYHKIECGNKHITKHYRLLDPYFTELPNA